MIQMYIKNETPKQSIVTDIVTIASLSTGFMLNKMYIESTIFEIFLIVMFFAIATKYGEKKNLSAEVKTIDEAIALLKGIKENK